MAKAIMIQGTASGVGKSITATALCRILAQDGYRVAPFKSQNMSSNFHQLPNGERMARSQVIAAYACNVEPTSDMNPILLMPNANQETEVIMNGHSVGQMGGFKYSDMKRTAFEKAIEAYRRLESEYDVVIIEGAGSPVEMNLIKDGDTANMGIAEAIDSPVILVSDIVRGGVFAALYGTIQLFTEHQRSLVKGVIINKFLGQLEHFSDGGAIIEELCGVPVLGVLPFTDVQLEDEDSLTDFGAAMKTRLELMAGDTEAAYRTKLDNEFDKLAAHFRTHLNMEYIYDIINN